MIIRISFLIAVVFSAAMANARICVLSFLPDNDPITKTVVNIFEHYTPARIRTEAVPLDLIRCIREHDSQIIMIAHAFELKSENPEGSPKIRLGYVVRSEHSPQSTGPTYVPKIFLDQIFRVADQVLTKEKNSDAGTKLKEIRLMACDARGILSAYPSLLRMTINNHIKLDLAPSSPFLSLFYDVPVTSLNLEWLSKSIDPRILNAWRTSKNSYCTKDYWPGCNRKTASYVLPR